MNLLGRLDKVLGSNVMERPAFKTSAEPLQPSLTLQPSMLKVDVEHGIFDALFTGADKPSALIRQLQNVPPNPSVELARISPFRPTSYTLPEYLLLARMANIEGQVSFALDVNADGHPSACRSVEGHPLLQKSIDSVVSDWVFPPEAANRTIQATIEFKTNCAPRQR